jgi:hypothetical protein
MQCDSKDLTWTGTRNTQGVYTWDIDQVSFYVPKMMDDRASGRETKKHTGPVDLNL